MKIQAKATITRHSLPETPTKKKKKKKKDEEQTILRHNGTVAINDIQTNMNCRIAAETLVYLSGRDVSKSMKQKQDVFSVNKLDEWLYNKYLSTLVISNKWNSNKYISQMNVWFDLWR